ncbi:MAG: hypothetical protein JWN98_1792, partial [Abditibacteriota bacterium]|nr:hypothetical protein [Abditibacteriota bacterium]
MKHFTTGSRLRNWISLILLQSTLIGVAGANDSSLDWSGTPRMMQGGGTISMQSEVVRIEIGRKTYRVRCDFVFRNKGAATTVRMGFPDNSLERGGDSNETLRSGFTNFRSWVDGRRVQTRLMRGAPDPNNLATYWHTKAVRFPAHRTLRVRDEYTAGIGSELTFMSRLASYTLHTGASWNGPIGRSEIIVTFGPHAPLPLKVNAWPFRQSVLNERVAMQKMTSWMRQYGRVVYQGPGKPKVSGRTLRWIRTNWKPTTK